MSVQVDARVQELTLGGHDPYVTSSGVLKNRFGLTDPADIKAAEADFVANGSAEAMNYLKAQTRFTFDVWKQAHRILFQDLYDWAGEPRSINMGREGKIVFNTAAEIPGEAAAVLDRVERSADFAADMGAFYAEMNFQHPFREGNGRTLKLLFSAIAFRRGLLLDWGRLNLEEYTGALAHWQRTLDAARIQAVLTACARPATPEDTF
ncbi:Fic/DOC family protein [Skermanella pratensis]|uniref:Fic/DOC family protein n=1 Tax=Skermanella pratensis TaxID=2233999 RepID=UPI0013014CC2|nr:Fic family protein [Skermanella pratensis]